MSKTNHNKTFAKWYAGIVSIVAMMLYSLLVGCNTEKRAVRQLVKLQAKHPEVVASGCGSFYPGLDSIHEQIIYKEGKPIIKSDTVTITDTLTNVVTKYITRTINTKDTAYITNYKQIVNRAKETAQAKTISDQEKTIAAQKVKIKWLAIAFGSIVLYWALKAIVFWVTKGRIKLP